MNVQAAEFIAYATKLLADADTMIVSGLFDHAARTAYMACFHAARAYIFECNGVIGKTHRGVQIEFARLTKDDSRVDIKQRAFLSRAYSYKARSDYFAGDDDIMQASEAEAIIGHAKAFVTMLRTLTRDCVTPPPTVGRP